MRRVSGIRFKDPKFLRDFEREVRLRYIPEECEQVLNSYTIHRFADDGVILEFRDLGAVEIFLEKARAVAVAGRTIRIIKLVMLSPTGLFRTPATEQDEWAQGRISRVVQEGRQRDSLICLADDYSTLEDEFRIAEVDLSKYVG